MSELLSMVTLRDRWKQLLMAPTVDKAASLFATMMLGFFILVLLSPILSGREIQYELLIIIGVSFIVSTFVCWWFKRYDQPARERESERLKKEITHEYLIKNPKLKETEITMDCLKDIRDEMSFIRQVLAAFVKEQEASNKYTEPQPTTPWSKVDVTSTETVGHTEVDSLTNSKD